MEYYLGIDIGSSAVKLILLDSFGEVKGQCAQEYEIVSLADGWREIDPEVWFKAVDAGMQALFSDALAPLAMSVSGIGVTGQMHTTVFMDAQGKSIRPAIMWNDTRTKSLLEPLRDEIEMNTEAAYTAKIISTGSPALNLYWLKQQEPENFSRLRKFLIGPDYIVYCLTGNFGTDYCEASTSSLYDFYKNDWSTDLGKLLGFPENIYPPIKGSGEIAGKVRSKLAERWRINPEARVLVGTGDNPAAALASGVMYSEKAVLSFGTSGVLVFSRNKVDFQQKGKHIAFSLDGEEICFLVQGVLQSVGRTMNWWMKKILQCDDFDADLKGVDIAKLGKSSVLFYPHLMGDKTIYHDISLRGAFLGLSDNTSRSEMEIAIMEGICLGVKELIERMEIPKEKINPLRVIGGGAKNKIWMQILADVLNVEVLQSSHDAGAAYGIALLAKRACKGNFNDGVVGRKEANGHCFSPRGKNVALYGKKYQKYLKIHSALHGIFLE